MNWDPAWYQLVFLRTPFWRGLRQECFERDGGRCVVPGCGSQVNLQAHHKVYRETPWDTRLEDLETRCEKHHEALHARQAEERQVSKRVQLRRERHRHLIEGIKRLGRRRLSWRR